MTREIICTRCPWIYPEAQITASRGDECRSLADLLALDRANASGAARTDARRTLKRLLGTPRASGPDTFSARQREKLSRLDLLQDWTFTCPNGHPVDGNRGQQIPLAVVGASGSSKSHFLPGMVWEASAHRALAPWGVSVREGQFTDAGLKFAMNKLYRENRALPPTPPDEVFGPFGYRLAVGDGPLDANYSLILFDVGGEALAKIARIREQAPFVLLSRAICVLIDPHNLLATKFDAPGSSPSPRQRTVAASDVRDQIALIADALQEMWGVPMREIAIPVCFTIAKADSVAWGFDFRDETRRVRDDRDRDSCPVRVALKMSSERVAEEFRKAGGDLIVDEILDRFCPDMVRFAAASATSQMPRPADGETDAVWDDPEPAGTALVLLHVLDMLDVLPAAPVAVAVDVPS